MFQRRFARVTVFGVEYTIGSVSEGEIASLLSQWQRDPAPLRKVDGGESKYSRDDCYRARVVQICLWRANLMGRHRDLSSDSDLLEIVEQWDGGLVRAIYETAILKFLNPRVDVQDFLPDSNTTSDASWPGE